MDSEHRFVVDVYHTATCSMVDSRVDSVVEISTIQQLAVWWIVGWTVWWIVSIAYFRLHCLRPQANTASTHRCDFIDVNFSERLVGMLSYQNYSISKLPPKSYKSYVILSSPSMSKLDKMKTPIVSFPQVLKPGAPTK